MDKQVSTGVCACWPSSTHVAMTCTLSLSFVRSCSQFIRTAALPITAARCIEAY